jgi:DNA mismatch repair protein MutS2
MTFFLHPQLPEKIGLTDTLSKMPLETEYGRLARAAVKPYDTSRKNELEVAWQEIGQFLQSHQEHPGILKEIRQLLHGMKNIRKSLKSAAANEVLTDVELFEVKKQAFAMERIRSALNRHRRLLVHSVTLCEVLWLIELLDPENTRIETFYLYDQYDPSLKQIRKAKQELEERLLLKGKKLERELMEATKIQPLWNGEVLVPKNEKKQKERLLKLGTYEPSGETSSEWIFRQRRHPESDEIENLLLQEEALEYTIRKRLSITIGEGAHTLLKNTEVLGHLDLLVGKTLLAVRHQACRPQMCQRKQIIITGGRHPVLEEILHKNHQKMMPIDLTMKQGATVITGANMGGKTMTLKMAALLTTMAQMGFWVPADEFLFHPVKWLYFSSGDEQSQLMGLSTFGAEIHALKKVLDMTDESGLILLDELASGTNPREGASISCAIVAHLCKSAAISVITTHYDGVGDLQGVTHLQVVGLQREILQLLQQKIKDNGWSPGLFEAAMDYRLRLKEPGTPVPKDAIAVAEIMGLKQEILEEARKNMETLSNR